MYVRGLEAFRKHPVGPSVSASSHCKCAAIINVQDYELARLLVLLGVLRSRDIELLRGDFSPGTWGLEAG